MTPRERKLEDLKEQLFELLYTLKKYNDKVNYFDEDQLKCYVALLAQSQNDFKLRNFTGEFPADLLEECKANYFAYLDEKTRKHSELYYFQDELSRYGF